MTLLEAGVGEALQVVARAEIENGTDVVAAQQLRCFLFFEFEIH